MDFWLIFACLGLGMALFWVIQRFRAARAKHVENVKNGTSGALIREQIKAEREKENMRRGAEAAKAIALGLQLKADNKNITEILGEVAKTHPEGVWFLVEKFLAGDIDLNQISQLGGALK